MLRKKHVRDRLYDFLSGSLPDNERSSIESHLAHCRRCSMERARVEEALNALVGERAAAPIMPQTYWDGYWKAIELRLKTSPQPSGGIEKLLEIFRGGGLERVLSPRIAYGALGFALGAIVTLGILSPYISKRSQTESGESAVTESETQTQATESATLSSVTQEISQPLIRFFQKAKAFLIAVKNIHESKEPARDLLSEQETSKKLAAECRNLKRLPLDPRERQLLSELDVVLVQLSKVKSESDSLKLDLVKEGIERNNLLMRIRVHELAHEVRLLQAGQGESNASNSF